MLSDLVPCLALLQLLSVGESEEGHLPLVGRLKLLSQVVQSLQLGEVEVTQLGRGGRGGGGEGEGRGGEGRGGEEFLTTTKMRIYMYIGLSDGPIVAFWRHHK